MLESDMDFGIFLATRNWPKVRAERFIEKPSVTLDRSYDNTTESHLLLIRAAVHTNQKDAA